MPVPTINDVAASARVSRQTVSNVLNSPDIVRPETRARVLAAVRELGYRPHASARRLRTRRAATLAVRIDPTPEGISGSVLDVFLHALTHQADGRGLRVMLYTAEDPDDEVRVIERLVEGSDVDALVLTSTFHGDPRVAWLLGREWPFVTFGRPWGADLDDPRSRWVDVDGRLGVRAATEHLLGRGCSRVGFVGWPTGSGTGDERRRGWSETLAVVGVGADDPVRLSVSCEDDLVTAEAAVATLLAREPDIDGLVAASDTLALAGLVATGGRLPVVGFDNTPVAASLGFSSVDQRLDLVAARVLALVAAVTDPAAAGPTNYLVTPELVVREPASALGLLR